MVLWWIEWWTIHFAHLIERSLIRRSTWAKRKGWKCLYRNNLSSFNKSTGSWHQPKLNDFVDYYFNGNKEIIWYLDTFTIPYMYWEMILFLLNVESTFFVLLFKVIWIVHVLFTNACVVHIHRIIPFQTHLDGISCNFI